MEYSAHYRTDKYGYKYKINTECEYAVFGSEPALSFDIKAHGIKLQKKEYYDYSIRYEIRDGYLYWKDLSFVPAPLFKPTALFGTEPEVYARYSYYFKDLLVDYSGVWQVGKGFDFRFWPGDEKAKPTPFCPEVYKQNGFIRFENGRIVEIELHPRKDQ